MELLNLLPSYKDVLLYNRCTDTEEGGLQTTLFIPLILYAIYKGLIFLRGLYRRHLHPLRKFPGHSEACVSTAWAYSEALKGYPEETFEVLHKRYNTKALRVGPNELHISDPELYKVIYKQGDSFPKYGPFYESFAASHSLFTETDSVKHKERRRILSPMFSRTGILKLEPLMHEKLSLLDSKIEKLCHIKEIDIYNAFRLLTSEVIMQFSFAKSAEMINEHDDNFNSRFTDALTAAVHSVSYAYENPLVGYIGKCLPAWILRIISPEMSKVLDLVEFGAQCVRQWDTTRQGDQKSHPVIFDRLTSLTEAEKITEAIDILVAGSDTTASSAATAVVQILSHPEIERKLVNSLVNAIPSAADLPPLLELEKIEYLTACVKECIRFSSSVPGRLPRVVPSDSKPLIVDGLVIPPGTIVSMSAHAMHTSVGVWGPDARSFNPDRWLAPNSKNLEQYQVSFSKGSRMCIGQKVDVFTLEYEKPGIPIRVTVR